MADRVVLIADHEVVPELEAMGLDREKLIDVVRVAAAERALCTGNDVKGFGLIVMHDKVVRGLREAFCSDLWERDEFEKQEGIRHRQSRRRVIACNFDHHTADPVFDPTNLVTKGEASKKKARCNATPWLPGLPDEIEDDDGGIETWVLGTYVDDDKILAELSKPVRFVGGQYKQFGRRIVLLNGSESSGGEPARLAPQRDGPVEIVDIVVRRK